MNHYDNLGIKPTSDLKEIKSAYRKLAAKYHPDRNSGDKSAEEKFKSINNSYDIIVKAIKGGVDPNSFDSRATNNSSSKKSNTNYSGPYNKDIYVNENIPLTSIFSNTTKRVSYRIENGRHDSVTIEIPKSVESGYTFIFRLKGEFSNFNRPAGDLYVRIVVVDDDNFKRISKFDVQTSIDINQLDLLIGSTSNIKCLDGSKIAVSIPNNSMDKDKLRITGKGLPKPDGTFGDMYIVLNVVRTTLTDTQIKALKYIRDEIKK